MSIRYTTPYRSLRIANIPDSNWDEQRVEELTFVSYAALFFQVITMILFLFTPAAWSMYFSWASWTSLFFILLGYNFFPSQASTRFVTTTLNRPLHFTAMLWNALAVFAFMSLHKWFPSMLSGMASLSTTYTNALALMVSLFIMSHGRHAINFIALTHRLLITLMAWGSSIILGDSAIMSFVGVALLIDLMHRVHARWVPLLTNARSIQRYSNPLV